MRKPVGVLLNPSFANCIAAPRFCARNHRESPQHSDEIRKQDQRSELRPIPGLARAIPSPTRGARVRNTDISLCVPAGYDLGEIVRLHRGRTTASVAGFPID